MNISKQWFQNNKAKIEFALLFCYFSINGLVNATTVIMHDIRDSNGSFLTWEPFIWELSSAYSTLVLIPILALFTKCCVWQWNSPLTSFFKYLCAAIVFSLFHILVMVLLREFSYSFSVLEYEFSTDLNTFAFELFYEIRKDIWSFVFFVIAIEVYRYSVCQWLGDTKPIFQSSETLINEDLVALPETLLVKKLGKEFLIKTREIQSAESAGNYINLYINGMTFPMRSTMTEFVEKAKGYGFVRIHRSVVVNTNWIEHIEKQPSGDSNVQMKDGKLVKLSRRYKKELELFIGSLQRN